MAKKPKLTAAPADKRLKNVSDYRFPEATRKNNPPAKIAAEGDAPLIPKAEYSYSPRRPPELRFDPAGSANELPELLAKATKQKLAEALRVHEPWLEWAGRREAKSFTANPVALHIHERVSAQAILKVAVREDVNRSLFADPEQERSAIRHQFGSNFQPEIGKREVKDRESDLTREPRRVSCFSGNEFLG